MTSIPEQFQRPDYRFIRLVSKDKAPKESDSWKYNLRKFDDEELSTHLAEGGNYGFVCGPRRTVVLDMDTQEFADKIIPTLPKTLLVKTGRGIHAYFQTDEKITEYGDFAVLDDDGKKCGELRIQDCYVVAPGSIHPDGPEYTVYENNPIATIPKKKLLELLSPYFKKKTTTTQQPIISVGEHPTLEEARKWDDKLDQLLNGNETGYSSTSEAEIALCYKLVFYGFGDSEIDNIMTNDCRLDKWREANPSYRNLTLSKAKEGQTERWKPPLTKSTTQPTTPESEDIEVYWFDELKNDSDEPLQYLVEGIIPEDALCILSGKPGVNKTFFALQMASKVATGEPFFGKNTKQGKVVYFDGENGRKGIRRKFKQLKQNFNLKCPIAFVSPQGLFLDKPKGIKFVEDFVKENPEIKLLIVDPVSNFYALDENNSEDVLKFLSPYRKLTHQLNISILFIMHWRKSQIQSGHQQESNGDEVRGSSVWNQMADSHFSLKRLKSGIGLSFDMLKLRGGVDGWKALVETNWTPNPDGLDTLNLVWKEGEEELGTTHAKCVEKLRGLSQTLGTAPVPTGVIQEEMQKLGFNSKGISRAIKALEEEGSLQKQKRGWWVLRDKGTSQKSLSLTLSQTQREGVRDKGTPFIEGVHLSQTLEPKLFSDSNEVT